jgi:hypothetical protein
MMPLGRYFACVGGLLVALLFLVDWYLPQSAARDADAEVDRSIIRIHSAPRWPAAVVFDTTQPTIAPPQANAHAEAVQPTPPPATRPPHPTPALAQAAEVPAAVVTHISSPRRQAKRRVRIPRPVYSSRVASYEPFGLRPDFGPSW